MLWGSIRVRNLTYSLNNSNNSTILYNVIKIIFIIILPHVGIKYIKESYSESEESWIQPVQSPLKTKSLLVIY